MIADPKLLLSTIQNSDEPLSTEQREALQSAVGKIVALGAQNGVTPEQMIELLKSGLTVGELLEYLSGGAGEVD